MPFYVEKSEANMTKTNIKEPVPEIPFPGLVHHNAPDVGTVVWSNRQIPKNNYRVVAFIAGWLIFTALAIFLTTGFLRDINFLRIGIPQSNVTLVISLLFMFASWWATIYATYYLLRFTWTETIRVSNDDLSILFTGLLTPKGKDISKDDIRRLSFEKIVNLRERESRLTLNIFHANQREILAYWLRQEEKYQLYLLLKNIFSARGWENVEYKAEDESG